MILVAIRDPLAYKQAPVMVLVESTVSGLICIMSLALVIFPLRHPIARYSVCRAAHPCLLFRSASSFWWGWDSAAET